MLNAARMLKKVEAAKHLCDTCSNEFAVCKGDFITGFDLVGGFVSGALADKVMRCENYKRRKNERGN